MAEKSNNRLIWWLAGFAALMVFLILGRGLIFILPRVIIPGLILLLAFGVYLYFKEDKPKSDDFTNEVDQLINRCQTELSDLNQKATRLARSKVELKEKLIQENPSMEETLRAETQRLLSKYEAESQVIQAKREFFKDMLDRAKSILSNYQWKKKLAEKESELNDLREDHYDDVVAMENVKQDVAYSRGFFDALNDLSNKIDSSTETKSILELREELKSLIPKQ